MKIFLKLVMVMAGLVGSMHASATESAQYRSRKSIAEIAVQSRSLKTLVAALDAAGLVDTLAGPGSFTVFAPTDRAFSRLADGVVAGLLNDKPALTGVLTYHVTAGETWLKDLIAAKSAVTLQGSPVTIRVIDRKVLINGSYVTARPIRASNGIIYIIDTVLLP